MENIYHQQQAFSAETPLALEPGVCHELLQETGKIIRSAIFEPLDLIKLQEMFSSHKPLKDFTFCIFKYSFRFKLKMSKMIQKTF